LSDAGELRTIIAGANFRDIAIRRGTKTLRYASIAEFVLGYVSGSALVGVVGVDESARAALLAENGNAIVSACWIGSSGLNFFRATSSIGGLRSVATSLVVPATGRAGAA
jgi:hypothetical protein